MMAASTGKVRATSATAFLLAAACLLPVSPGRAHAADIVKSAGTTGILTSGSTWVGSIVPTSSDTAVFDSTLTTSGTFFTNATGTSLSVYGIKVTNPGGAITLSGTTTGNAVLMSIGAGGIDMATATQNLTIVNNNAVQLLTLTADQTWAVNTGRLLTINAQGFSLNRAIAINGGGQVLFNQTVAGSGTFNVTNAVLSGSYSTPSARTISPLIAVTTSTFATFANASLTINSVTLNSGGAWIHTHTGTGGALSGTGARAFNGGTFTASRTHASGTFENAISGSVTVGAQGGTIVLTGSANNFTQAPTLTISGNIGGAGRLTVSNTATVAGSTPGASAIIFSGTNSSFAGTFDFQGGNGSRLYRLGASTAGSGSATFNIASGNTLEVNAVSVNLGNLTGSGTLRASTTGTTGNALATVGGLGQSGTFSGVIADGTSGTMSLTKTGGGTLTLAGINTYSGVTTVNAGVLALGAANVLSGSTAVTISGGVLDTTASNYSDTVGSFTISSGTLAGGGTITAGTYGLGGGAVNANLGNGTLNVTANAALNGTSDAAAVNLNAGTLTLGSGGRFSSASAAVTGSSGAGLVLGGNESFGSLSGDANIALGGNTLSVGSANTSTTYSGSLAGSGLLAKIGSGTFILSGSNSYSGGTQIAAGTLELGSLTALPTSSAVTLGTGSTSATLSFSGNEATLGSITFNGSGSQMGTGTGGKLNLLASGTANATITVASGSHILHPDTSFQSNAVIDVASGALFTLHGVVDGGKSLTKLGSGTLTINGVNSYTGGSYLGGGYVNVLNTGGLSDGTVTIDGNTILNLNNTILSNAVVFGSGSGAIINSGSLVSVSGTYSITSGTGGSITTSYSVLAGGDISFVGDLASTVQVQGGAVGTFTSGVLSSAAVQVTSGGRVVFSGSVTGPVTTSGSSLFSAGVLGNVTVGGGTATFSGSTDAASAVNVNGGLAVFTGTLGGIAHATASGATVEIRNRVLNTADVNAEAGGTVKLMGNQAFDASTIGNDGSVIVNRTANLTLAAVISGSGSLTKSDALALTLTGNNTFTGLTTISGGTLSIGNGGTSGALAGNVVNEGVLVFNRSDTYGGSFASSISGSGGLRVAAGALTLGGSNGYLGATNVLSGGTLRIAAAGSINTTSSIDVASGGRFDFNGSGTALIVAPTLAGDGILNRAVLGGAGTIAAAITLDNLGDTLSPGNSPGILTFGTSQTWASFSYDWEVNDFIGLTAGTAFDQIAIDGSLDLSGGMGSYMLDVISLTGANSAGAVPNFSNASRQWTILATTGGITGFNAAHWTINPSGFSPAGEGAWSLDQSGSSLILQYVVVPEPTSIVLAGTGFAVAAGCIRRRRAARGVAAR